MNTYVQLEERLQHGDIMIKFRQFNEHLTMCHITNDDSSCWAYSRCVSVVLSKNEWESKREKKKTDISMLTVWRWHQESVDRPVLNWSDLTHFCYCFILCLFSDNLSFVSHSLYLWYIWSSNDNNKVLTTGQSCDFQPAITKCAHNSRGDVEKVDTDTLRLQPESKVHTSVKFR